MKKKSAVKWGTVVCLTVLVSTTTQIGRKRTFNAQTLENVKALAEEDEAQKIVCLEGGDLICPFFGIKVYDYINFWSLQK